MPRFLRALMFSFWLGCSPFMTPAQEVHLSANGGLGGMKALIVAAESKSDDVVAVPPATSATILVRSGGNKRSANAMDLANWLQKETALNGLESPDLLPWHVVVTYEQFASHGNSGHRGVYEEFWVGAKKYRRIYKSDNLNQTDYATEKGLYRRGDQQWPNPAQSQVRDEIINPFYYGSTLTGFHVRNVERTFGGYKLQCVAIENNSITNDPTQYCFEPGGLILRYDRGSGWFQTVYNRIVAFQGRNLAQEVDVTDGGEPFLKLHVNTIELIAHVDDADFLPPPGAVGPLGDRVSGVRLTPINRPPIVQWPASLRMQHFVVEVQIVVGKDGRVISAHGVSGPPQGYKACESAMRKLVFKPYLVLDKPVEVELKVECANN